MAMKLRTLAQRVPMLNTQRAPVLSTESQRIAGTTLQRIRQRVLRRAQGLCECEKCRAPGVVPLPAEHVDHIVPLWEGGSDDPHDDSNRQALSIPCHNEKSAAEAKRRAGR